ncbi:MAG: peroxidase family protein [Chitinophagales bacterium]
MKLSLSFLTVLSFFTLFIQAQDNRSFDGRMNNVSSPDWGATGEKLTRVVTNGYADGMSEPGMVDYPNPRMISNLLYDQPESMPNPMNISDYGWAFGQFIDHDITFVDDMLDEVISIPVPQFDPIFDPTGTGTSEIFMRRSKYDLSTGFTTNNPRAQINDITAWIDASNVYGSDENRANWLRTFENGKLKTSEGNFLPFNTLTGNFEGDIDPNAPFMVIEGAPMPKHFVAGDVRANEQPILTCVHTLFMREHNRLCGEIAAMHPTWNDEQLYQYARKMVGAYIQSIAFNEWLPALGITLDDYTGYDETRNPNIMNVFSAAAFRLGHTLLNDHLVRMDNDGQTISEGNIRLKDAFFNPFVVVAQGGIDPILKGMATQAQQTFDTKVVGDLRNFLFAQSGAGGLDLVAININRARERGLPGYNKIRSDFGMGSVADFAAITSNLELQNQLQSIYGNVDAIDPWVGMLAEDHKIGSAVGSTVYLILQHQFQDLRDGDRFFYKNDPAFTIEDIEAIDNTSLAQIVLRNTDITFLQENIFFAKSHDEVVAIQDVTSIQNLVSLYPNPTQNEFTLSLDISKTVNAQLQIFSINGELMDTQNFEVKKGKQQMKYQFPDNLTNGIYYVVMTIDGEIRREKVVKI